ncbi:MAG: DUF2442 domain-containing protein [Chloroflexi bacterium]|nr:DUF2442 domain-containing protein [Chloroflexota bacterium]
MFPRIKSVKHKKDYVLELEFTDGRRAQMDFAKKVVGRGGVFALLEDVEFFKQVRVDSESGTIAWPNDVDLDPDVLYSEAMGVPIPKTEMV